MTTRTLNVADIKRAGLFRVATNIMSEWLANGLGPPPWTRRDQFAHTMNDVLDLLAPDQQISKYVLTPLGNWTLLQNNARNGTGVGVLPSYAARELSCRALRVTSTADSEKFPARIIEIYEPDGPLSLRLARSIAAATDGGQWVFETVGAPYPFEELDAYAQRRKSKRLTAQMVEAYVKGLGVPDLSELAWQNSVAVCRA